MTLTQKGLSVNRLALPLVEEIIRYCTELSVHVEKTPEGAMIIDAGIKTRGGYLAGRLITEICLGGMGTCNLSHFNCGDLTLPAISVTTDQPSISLFGSQYAGWRISAGKYFAMASGPARALALKPR
jgi:methenyltetrahydromethanopterin cyclohydrolase